jgi:hypothetical protein
MIDIDWCGAKTTHPINHSPNQPTKTQIYAKKAAYHLVINGLKTLLRIFLQINYKPAGRCALCKLALTCNRTLPAY